MLAPGDGLTLDDCQPWVEVIDQPRQPVRFSLAKPRAWLDGRIGAERQWRAWKYTPWAGSGYAEVTRHYSSTQTFLGATAHWNRMILDLLVSPEFMHTGPNFVSGTVITDLFARVSLKYDFTK